MLGYWEIPSAIPFSQTPGAASHGVNRVLVLGLPRVSWGAGLVGQLWD